MSQPLYTLDVNNHILEAAEHMTDKNTRHITVTDQGKTWRPYRKKRECVTGDM